MSYSNDEKMFREHKKVIRDMRSLGYEFAVVEGFSDDFLMWRDKGSLNASAFGMEAEIVDGCCSRFAVPGIGT